jgi:acyl-CoA thioester hydrolase
MSQLSDSIESAPLALHRETVLPEWTDYNGHMNMAYYMLAFDHASDRLFDFLDIGADYLKRNNHSLFTLEAHITYERELKAGDPLRVTTQLLDRDAKRLHYCHLMYHGEEGCLAATNELICIHVDVAKRRSAPFPPDALARIERLVAAHGALPRPSWLGRVIGIRRAG